MAVVFLATDSRDGPIGGAEAGADRHRPRGARDPRGRALGREAAGAVLPGQPQCAGVYEHGTEGGYFYIAMEYLEGRNLSEVIGDGPLAPERAAGIAIQLCEFLEAAHGFEATIDGRHLRSLLHGDLKPRNIRVLDGDRIKVLDFGIAKALSLSRKVTRNDFGSIAYLSPERLESGEIDAQADFWAVGVLLYEMVSGVQPFRAPDTRRLEQRIRSLRPAAPLEPPCPPGLQAIVAKLLAGRCGGSLPRRRRHSRRSRVLRGRCDHAGAARGLAGSGARRTGDAPHATPASPVEEEATRRTLRATADLQPTALSTPATIAPPVQPQPAKPPAPVPRCTSADSAVAARARHRRQRAVGGFPGEARQGRRADGGTRRRRPALGSVRRA